MKIRKITQNEVQKFHQVFEQVIKDDFPEYFPELINYFIGKDFNEAFRSKKMKDWKYTVLIAEEEKEMVGFLVMEKLSGGVSFCTWIGVIGSCQGKGIGSSLISKWERLVLSEGGHKLKLIIHSNRNRNFYLKNGFKEEGFEEKSWYGIDYWLFGKVIGEPKPAVFLR